MLQWLAGENFGLAGADDQTILAWAADHNRILLTHDVSTITAHAYRRIMKGHAMPGVFEVSRRVNVRSAAEDMILLSECSAFLCPLPT